MTHVRTAHGLGEVIETSTSRGRTQYRVAGKGFDVWLDETKVQKVAEDQTPSNLFSFGPMQKLKNKAVNHMIGTADGPDPEDTRKYVGRRLHFASDNFPADPASHVNEDNTTDLPYDFNPQYPVELFDSESTISPDHEIDEDERTSPTKSLSGESGKEREYPGPNPDLFAKGAGLSSKYIQIEAAVDHFNDPVQKFRDDPVGQIQRLGYVDISAGLDHETGEWMTLVEADKSIRTAAWRDVRQKAQRLRREGAVDVEDLSYDRIYAKVKGDNGVYDVMIAKGGDYGQVGNQGISNWRCSCDWGKWAFKRQKTFIGRLCSHGYAAYLTMQSDHTKGRRGPKGQFKRQSSVVDDFTKWVDDHNNGHQDYDAVEGYLSLQPEPLPREDAEKLYEYVSKNPAERPERNYDVDEYSYDYDKVYKEGELLRRKPLSLKPDMYFVPEGEEEHFVDVEKDERKTTGPGQIQAGRYDDPTLDLDLPPRHIPGSPARYKDEDVDWDAYDHATDVFENARKNPKDYPDPTPDRHLNLLPGMPSKGKKDSPGEPWRKKDSRLARLVMAELNKRWHSEKDEHDPIVKFSERRAALVYTADEDLLNKLRDLSAEAPGEHNQHMKEHVEELADVVDELHDRGYAASPIVASIVRIARDNEHDIWQTPWGGGEGGKIPAVWDWRNPFGGANDEIEFNSAGGRDVAPKDFVKGLPDNAQKDLLKDTLTGPARPGISEPSNPQGFVNNLSDNAQKDLLRDTFKPGGAPEAPEAPANPRADDWNPAPGMQGMDRNPNWSPTKGGDLFTPDKQTGGFDPSGKWNINPDKTKIDSGTYTVQPGDTTQGIADRSGISLEQLQKNNAGGIKDTSGGASSTDLGKSPELIHPGDVMNTGTGWNAKTPAAPEAPKAPEVPAAAQPAANNVNNAGSSILKNIKGGSHLSWYRTAWETPSTAPGNSRDDEQPSGNRGTEYKPVTTPPATGPAAGPSQPSSSKSSDSGTLAQGDNGAGTQSAKPGSPLAAEAGGSADPNKSQSQSGSGGGATQGINMAQIGDLIGQAGGAIGGALSGFMPGVGGIVQGLSSMAPALFHGQKLSWYKDANYGIGNQGTSAPGGAFGQPGGPSWADMPFSGSGPEPKLWSTTSADYVDEHERDRHEAVDDGDGDITSYTKKQPKQSRRIEAYDPLNDMGYYNSNLHLTQDDDSGSPGDLDLGGDQDKGKKGKPKGAPKDVANEAGGLGGLEDALGALPKAASLDDSDIVRQFQASGGGALNYSGNGGGFSDDAIAKQAQRMLRTAGRVYSLAEQRELEQEEHHLGARNLDGLDLEGTHYL